MKDLKTFLMLMLTLMAQTLFVACGGDDNDDSAGFVNEQITIGDDGKASNGGVFSSIDDKNFYLDYIKYTVTEGHLAVSGYDKSGFKGDAKIVSSITYKGNFYEVLEIGDKAFYDCKALVSISIPSCVTSIGKSAFSGCSSLTSINIPNSVMSIGNSAFKDCTSLTSINIPDDVKSIDAEVFYRCSSLTSITIPDGVTSINEYAFAGCSSLNSINIPDNITSIDDGVFMSCISLTSVSIPDGVTTIGNQAFEDCSSLTSINIPDGVTSIGLCAFLNCISLPSISIPASVTWIEADAFLGCKALTSMDIKDLSAWCKISFSNDWSNPLMNVHHLFVNGEEVKDLIIPNDVTNIRNFAFIGCSYLNSITLHKNVTSIGSYAFSHCDGLTTISIPSNVTSIGQGAFTECNGVTSLRIEDSEQMLKVGDNCLPTSLTTLYIGRSFKSLNEYYRQYENNNYLPFSYLKQITSLTFGKGCTSICDPAFYDCNEITAIHCLGTTPPKYDAYWGFEPPFSNTVYETATLYVPRGSAEAYIWYGFKNIVEE